MKGMEDDLGILYFYIVLYSLVYWGKNRGRKSRVTVPLRWRRLAGSGMITVSGGLVGSRTQVWLSSTMPVIQTTGMLQIILPIYSSTHSRIRTRNYRLAISRRFFLFMSFLRLNSVSEDNLEKSFNTLLDSERPHEIKTRPLGDKLVSSLLHLKPIGARYSCSGYV